MAKNEKEIEIKTSYSIPSNTSNNDDTNSPVHMGRRGVETTSGAKSSALGVPQGNNMMHNSSKDDNNGLLNRNSNPNAPKTASDMPGVVGSNRKPISEPNSDVPSNRTNQPDNKPAANENSSGIEKTPMGGVKAPTDNNQNNNPGNNGLIDSMPGVKNGQKKDKNKEKPIEKSNDKDKKPLLNKKGDKKNIPFLPGNMKNLGKKGAKKSVNSNGDKNGLGFKDKLENGLGLLSTFIPQARIAQVVVKFAVPIGIALIIVLILIAIFVTTMTSTMMNTGMCETDNSSSNSDTGSVDASSVRDFLCKMQSPLGDKSYTVSSLAGEARSYESHPGIDLAISPQGTPIYAVQSGKVVLAGVNNGYGYSVDIDHGNGFLTRYGHMIAGSLKVKKGDKVGKGQRIGSMGSTGWSTGPHLHFEIKINDKVQTAQNAYFKGGSVSKDFKKSCGSSWDGELAGDSASKKNDTNLASIDGDSSSSSSNCCVEESGSNTSSSSSDSSSCPNGILVEGKNMNLDDYIAGVVTAENSYKDGKNIEASKAQAIAARTYALYKTKNCKGSIGNSQSDQVYISPGSIGKDSSKQTSSQVMLYKKKLFLSEYDSFCSYSGSATYLKQPTNDKTVSHNLILANKYRGDIAGGHCHGMSQLYARQLQDEGRKYDEILRFFYADGIEITGASSNTCSIGGDSFNGKIVPFYQKNYNQPYAGGTIASDGCGPTAMAMVVSTLLNAKHEPPELADFATKNHYYVTGVGTSHIFFEAAGKHYGLKVKQVSLTNKGEVLTSLNSGKALVIAAMGPGEFTNNGHFIVLTGVKNGKVSVQDPASEQRSKKTYDFEKVIVKEASKFWIITK